MISIPLVSLIIPIYGVEKYIVECLESILNQTYDNIEVIIINDCTPDNSMVVANEVINQLQLRYSVKIVEHEVNKGLSETRNSGVKVSTGEWLFFLDSDDKLVPNAISLFIGKVIEYPNVDLITGTYLPGTGRKIEKIKNSSYIDNDNKEVISRFIDGDWCVNAQNKLIRRSLFIDRNLWFIKGYLHEDIHFSFYLACGTNSHAYLLHPTYYFRQNQSSIVNNQTIKNSKDRQLIYENIMDYINVNPNLFKTVDIYKYLVERSYLIILETMRLSSKNTCDIEKNKIINRQVVLLTEAAEFRNIMSLSTKVKEKITLSPRLARIYFNIYYTIKLIVKRTR